MTKDLGKHLLYIFISAYIFLQVFVLLFGKSEYGFGGADNINHYQIARYAFSNPELFLDLWGKPVYTTLLAPFSLLGYNVAKAFNILVLVFALVLSVKITDYIRPGYSLPLVVLLAFAPIYFFLATSCLTELLFSLVLVAAVYAFIRNRYILAAVIISFLPFVRSEGVVILPVFAVVLILVRSYKSLFFLLSGALFYSIVGYFVFNDFFWIFNNQPYSLGESVYGSGDLFHFVKKSNVIFGVPLLILIVSGSLYWAFLFIKRKSLTDKDSVLFLLITGSWVVYFAAHSYVWWKGTGGSLGLIRVMGGIIPLAAFSGLKITALLEEKIKRKQIVTAIISLLAFLQIILFFTQNKLLSEVDPTEQLVKKSAEYIRFNGEGRKIYYFNPLLIHLLQVDPYDQQKCNWGISDKTQPSNGMDWGDILVWDAHFGPNEGGVQLENLEKDPFLKKLKAFYPVEKVTVLGDYDYSVHIYKKAVSKDDSVVISEQYEQVLSFEDYTQDQVHQEGDRKVWELDSSQEFSPSITVTPDLIKRYELLDIKAVVNYKSMEDLGNDKVLFILCVDNKGENLRYEKMELVSSGDTWKKVELEAKMPANIPETSTIKVYVWNKDKKNILLDHLSVNITSR